ncbi:hypothetical protein ABZX51_011234 [Aspergillus tubingensis]
MYVGKSSPPLDFDKRPSLVLDHTGKLIANQVCAQSWTALSASLSLSLPSGGCVSVIWGLITAGVCNLCMSASLAEFLSAYPTAGGQYHWVAGE